MRSLSCCCWTYNSRFPSEDLQCHGALCQGVNPFCSSMELYRSLVVRTKHCSWSKSIALEFFCISSRDTHALEHRSIYSLRSTSGFQALLKDEVVRQRWTGGCCKCTQMCHISVTEWTFTTWLPTHSSSFYISWNGDGVGFKNSIPTAPLLPFYFPPRNNSRSELV